MTENPSTAPKRVVLRYEDDWDELRSQLSADRTAGLAPSAVRDGISAWLDDGSLVELGTLVRRSSSSFRGGDSESDEEVNGIPSDGLIAGWGHIAGRLVFVNADDTDLGSSVRGGAAAAKAHRVRQHALEQTAPLLQVLGSQRVEPDAFIGAEFVRFGYGVDLDFERHSHERILKIAIVTGPLTDQAAIEATWSHLTILAGPEAALYGFQGDDALARGFADFAVDDLEAALGVSRHALDHLPPNCFDGPSPPPPLVGGTSGEALGSLLDNGWSCELRPGWGPSVRTWLGQIGGRTVGLIDSQGSCVLEGPTVEKMLRLVNFCRAFRLPVVISHGGFDHPPEPIPSDVEAWSRLVPALQRAETILLEVAQGQRGLMDDLGVRPLWAVGDGSGSSVDAVATPVARRAAILDAVHALRPTPIRRDQDERVRHRPPRTLQGG